MFRFLAISMIAGLAARASPLQPTFTSCLESYSPVAASEDLLNVTSVYASLVSGSEASKLGLLGGGHSVLRLDLVGVHGADLSGYDNATNKLATLFTDTHAATFSVYESTTWLCNSLFPSELPEPYYPYNTTYCPLAAGDFAVNISIPLYSSYALTTLHTRIRMVDTSSEAANLACYDIHVSPLRESGWYYKLFLWLPVALVAGFWVLSWGARFATGWIVGSGVAEYGQKEGGGAGFVGGSSKREATLRKWGTMIISGLSGERLSVSGGLLRFVTPGVKDIMFHIQYTAMLGMIAVSWPGFAYPVFAQGAWANLVWNMTLVQGSNPDSKRIDIYPESYTASTAFDSQMTDSYYPLYLDGTAFNPLMDLHGSSNGMESFATTVGLRSQDLFGTCLVLFLIIAAIIIIVSLLLWALHGLLEHIFGNQRHKHGSPMTKKAALGSSSRASLGGKEAFDQRPTSSTDALGNLALPTQSTFFSLKSTSPSPLRRSWLRFRPRGEAGAFHVAALYGNLIRLILVFHLPITIFSIYQLTLGNVASITSRVFAALALAFVSVLIPAFILLRIYRTPTGKLYDATRTLLSLGPMYNIYVEKKQMFRVFPLIASLITGIAVGAGQKSGITQAVIIIVVEMVMLIVPGVWYPWGEGASMGAPNAFLGTVRLISMVLVMLLSEVIPMGETAADWIAYTILILQAIIFVFLLLMLLTKIIEGSIRLFGGVHFDESTHPLDGGIFAAIMDLDCLNPRGGKAAERKRRKRGSRQLQKNVYAAGSLTTQMMLDRHSQGVALQTPADQSTPFLYPVGYQPPLGPPPGDRLSSESRSEERPSDLNIMDAWRPVSMPGSGHVPPGAYSSVLTSPTSPPPDALVFKGHGAQPQGPERSFSVVRGGRSNFQNPYDIQGGAPSRQSLGAGTPMSVPGSGSSTPMGIAAPSFRVSQVGHRPMSPPHSRQKSSSAIIELASTPPASYAPLPSLGYHPATQGVPSNNQGVRPPTIAIPKRRSLNDLKQEDSDASPKSERSESEKRKKKGRSSGWFHRHESLTDTESEEGSDDEPGPSKRKARRAALMSAGLKEPEPFEDISTIEQPGWKKVLGIKKRGYDDLTELAKDENKARKAALAAESGSMFAGVEAPRQSPTKKAFVVKRSTESTRPGTSPLSPISPEGTTSFKVKRIGQPMSTPTPNVMDNPSKPKPVHPTPANANKSMKSQGANPVAKGADTKKSFKVIRPAGSPLTPTGSAGFVVNGRSPPSRQPSSIESPVATPMAPPAEPARNVGYPPTTFAPARPVKDPRRSSEDQGRPVVM